MVSPDFISFGEILFDCFDGMQTLGGAPLNVSVHLSRLGFGGCIISAVGNDSLGRKALEEIRNTGLSTERIAVLDGVATGRADVVLSADDADYEFNSPAAWDMIPYPERIESHASVIYFGTLAQRCAASRTALRRLLSNMTADTVFFDVNIRKSFYTGDIIREGLRAATVLKMNDAEVPIVLRESGCSSPDEICRRYSVSDVIITEGKQGSSLIKNDGSITRYSAGSSDAVDTVGAGDSLSAGFIASLLKGMTTEEALRIGSVLADYVVTKHGATPEYDEKIKSKLKELLG